MGVDIKLFVEMDYSESGQPFSESGNIRSLSHGEFFVWRNYSIYKTLAGIGSETDTLRIAPRGLPQIISEVVYNRYFCIVDERDYNDRRLDGLPSGIWQNPPVAEEIAQEWVDNGLSIYAPESFYLAGRRRRKRVSSPDWKYASWLSSDEFLEIMSKAEYTSVRGNPELKAIVAAVTILKEQLGPDHVRVVYWFDNDLPA